MSEKNIIYGRNAVMAALEGDRTIEKIVIQDGAKGSVSKTLSLAKEKGVRFDFAVKAELDKAAAGGAHQGVLAYVSDYEYADLNDVLAEIDEKDDKSGLLILLDEIEDPHNLGAIMRTAECAGVDGIIIPKRRSVGLTETVAKTSAGAIERVPCIKVTNMAKTIDELKDRGFWVFAADMDGENLWKSNLGGKLALVIGNEGKGVSRLVKEKCDFIVSIPMEGKVGSLNASNAAAVIMYEVMRQRMI